MAIVRLLQIAFLLGILCSCKVVTKPVTTAGTLAVKTAGVSGQIATQTVKTSANVTSQIATTGAKTTTAIARVGIKSATTVAKYQTVFLKDVSTGVIKEVPWQEGLRLYAATKGANIDMYGKAFTIFRNGGDKIIKTDWKKIKNPSGNPQLKPGDYVEIKPSR
ncbi:MAG: hypothetical protein ACP5K7_00625 [Verrucomicrobiia bacterium]